MKSKVLRGFLLKFVLPLIAFIMFLAFFKPFAAAFFAALYIAYMLYSARASIFAILGNITYGRGEMQKSAEWFKKAYMTGKARPNTIISYAYLLLKQGNIDESEKILAGFLNSKPDFDAEMLAKSNLALVLWKKDRLDDAINMLEEVFAQYKTTVIYGSLGYFYILKGDLDKALAFNTEAFEYNSTNTVILDNLGQTYYLRNDLDKAIEIYEKLMSSSPTYPEAYYNYGLVLDRMGQKDKAMEFMEKALNFRFTFLSTVTREEIEAKISELKSYPYGM